jgi:DNA-directed RNA polymerase subunit RPC12/RpoP
MAVDFRCEHCGKLLTVEAAGDSQVKCPHCKAKTTVPAALAAMPRPQVPPASSSASQSTPPPMPASDKPASEDADDEFEEGEVEESQLMVISAAAMPWVISIFFHLGLLLIAALVTMISIRVNEPELQVVPNAVLSDNPGAMSPADSQTPTENSQANPTQQRQTTAADSTIDDGRTDAQVGMMGITGASAGTGELGIAAASGGGPRSNFFGSGGNAYYVVYVVDRSGSMIDTFDFVRHEMIVSISRLVPEQQFHVILFAAGQPMEKTPKYLTPADTTYKVKAAEFLDEARPQGSTNPIPALQRAFSVLGDASGGKIGKLIYLLTDGDFPDNDKVLSMISSANRSKDVHINTYLYGHRGPSATDVMRRIAGDNGGVFTVVDRQE